MAEDQGKRIEVFLASKGKSVETISKQKMRQLCAIDDAVQAKLRCAAEAKNLLEQSSINISSIAEATGIARRTFYNNDILKDYVEQYSGKNTTIAAKSRDADNKTLKSENEELQRQVKGFVDRDIETGKLWHENEKLRKEIEHLSNKVESLQEHNENLKQELEKAKRNVPSNIIPMKI